jgi:general secretion pathway protein D
LSQDISNQKRRWLAALISVARPNVAWLFPAILSPVIATSLASNTVAQTLPPSPVTNSQPATPQVNADFVLSWLESAKERAGANDIKSSAIAFAEALRGRQALSAPDARVEARLREVEQSLLTAGVKKQQIVDAINTLGPIGALPATSKVNQTASMPSGNLPALPLLPTAQTAQSQLPATNPAPIVPAVASQPTTTASPIQSGVFTPGLDQTKMQQASAIQIANEPNIPSQLGGGNGDALYRRGIDALSKGDSKQAYDLFREAWKYQGEMDPLLRNQLREKLSLMSTTGAPQENVAAAQLSPIEQQQLTTRQRLFSEISGEIAGAEANRESEPQLVAERLQALRTRVSQADVDGAVRKQMLTIVDRAITSHQIYMTQNQASIDQNMRNRQVTEQLAEGDATRYKTEQQVASLVETYNDLMDKGDYAEAEVVAKQVGAIDPNSTITRLLIANARNARRTMEYEQIKARKEDKFIDALNDVDRAAIAHSDERPLIFTDAKEWGEITRNRLRVVAESRRGMSEAEIAIWEKLKQPVLVDFKARPLPEVVKTLSDMTGILIHIDQQGLAMEGFTSDMPITLSLPSHISLKSALNLMLNSQNLDFVVRNEVLMITSARNTAQANVARTYNVRDLVLPIPNFVSDYNSGLGGALRNAYETIGRGLVAQTGPVPGLAGAPQYAAASTDPNAPVLGQLNNQGMNNMGLPAGIPPQAMMWGRGFNNGPTYGAGNMGMAPMQVGGATPIQGGSVIADFDTLMMLIQQTIDPDSWLLAGGQSTITPYPANLSIVVSAPQTTHEKITDLLESLRQLQDLQVTIEVKFITLTDNFFERIGVDFDIRADSNVNRLPPTNSGPSTSVGISTDVGITGQPTFTSDLSVQLLQNSFGSAVPAFGNFDAASGASLGVAILSDLEMFFFMNAAQGDTRSNVLQAPRVTMFDGQTASINDTVNTPFVTSLIPVVGDFAVAQQPVIVVINEGTVLNVQAVVSPDKRFVRVTLNPTFSRIDSVNTFTFEGTRSTRSSSSQTGTNVLNPNGNVTNRDDDQQVVTTGSTVQQPSVAFTNISTTVSVPDGGTILLGGIKRMREGRIERGVPVLSKIPYVNRLFKNTAIGRETSTLMMTVTPRIIIQEEEEAKYGVSP